MTISKHQRAKQFLANLRQMTSLMDKELIAAGDEMVFDRTDWVPLYFDRGHAILSDCGSVTAYRAATLNLMPLWLVFTPGKSRGFHASAACPHDAIEQAVSAWARRGEVRRNWTSVRQTARDLIWGRARFRVQIEDAHASPLCSLGIDGFMRRVGIGQVRSISGRLAALLMMLEPQVGFVIYEAMQREGYAPETGAADLSRVAEAIEKG